MAFIGNTRTREVGFKVIANEASWESIKNITTGGNSPEITYDEGLSAMRLYKSSGYLASWIYKFNQPVDSDYYNKFTIKCFSVKGNWYFNPLYEDGTNYGGWMISGYTGDSSFTEYTVTLPAGKKISGFLINSASSVSGYELYMREWSMWKEVDRSAEVMNSIIDNPSGYSLPSPVLDSAPAGRKGMILLDNGSDALVTHDGTKFAAVNKPPTYSSQVLLVAGGGAGSVRDGGSGGAGGVIYATPSLNTDTTYNITIGAGGAGGSSSNQTAGPNGSNSTAFGYTAIGGGHGGIYQQSGASGGSGGGAGGSVSGGAGSGTSGQGNRGGNNNLGGSAPFTGGGGGGRGGVGGDVTANETAPAGGPGEYFGTYFTNSVGENGYFGGGAGGSGTNNIGIGGIGGGGNSTPDAGTAESGAANTGGGGGSARNGGGTWGAGGSGCCIIRVPTLLMGSYTGSPTVIVDGNDTILWFKGSGSYTA